jgi:hypothetical protein
LPLQEDASGAAGGAAPAANSGPTAATFRDFLLKPEILRAINASAFEHPSKGMLADLIPFRMYISRKTFAACWQSFYSDI